MIMIMIKVCFRSFEVRFVCVRACIFFKSIKSARI